MTKSTAFGPREALEAYRLQAIPENEKHVRLFFSALSRREREELLFRMVTRQAGIINQLQQALAVKPSSLIRMPNASQ